MKKTVIIALSMLLLVLSGCSSERTEIIREIDTGLVTYYELDDGTWMADGTVYQYRLEIRGRMHAAAADSTFVYLSNISDIPFEKAWKAAGFSSSTDDYFHPEEAILVDIRTD